MQPVDNLEAHIKEAILANGGDIDIENYPYILKEAEAQGLSRPELARHIHKIYAGIDWRPYNKIDKLLEPIFLSGSISQKEADAIVKELEQDLQRPQVENYILQNLKKRGFLPREKNAFEHDSFKNRWMTDEAWQRFEREKTAVEWLGEMAHSPEELGEISLRKPDDAKYFLRNANYLVPNITMLTKSPSKADEFSKIIEEESNLDRRYLKVLYRLNKVLPFRLDNQSFKDIHDLLNASAIDYTFFRLAADEYSKGHIHIWLYETNAAATSLLTSGYDYNSFLQFVYRVHPHHPFYLGALRFATPEALAQQAQQEAQVWPAIAAATYNRQLPVWLAGMGRHDWATAYEAQTTAIATNSFYNEEEKGLATVQAFLLIADTHAPVPTLVCDQQKVELLSVEGSKTVQHSLQLQLANAGFAKANIYLGNSLQGIALDRQECVFWSQNNITRHTLTINIAALQLVKNKTYTTSIHIDTAHQNTVIPLRVKVVFPVKAYLLQVLKYGLLGALFFVLVRYGTGVLAKEASWFSMEQASHRYPYLPPHYYAYFIGLLVLATGLIGAVWLIKKWEKL